MRSIIFCLFTFLSLLNINAQDTINSVFWEIEHPTTGTKSYLLGTLHLSPKNYLNIDKVIIEKIKSSQVLVLETDIKPSLIKQISLVEKMFLPAGTTIDYYMSDTLFKKLKSYYIDTLKKSEIQFNKLLRFKPIAIASLLVKEEIESPFIMEEFLYEQAQKFKVQIDILEEIDEQINIIDQIPLEKQCKIFFSDLSKNSTTDMLKVYKEQNLVQIYELLDEIKDEQARKLLIEARNYNWIEKLDKILCKQKAFVAVGAGHLPGEHGLLVLLRKKGYIVKPIKATF